MAVLHRRKGSATDGFHGNRPAVCVIEHSRAARCAILSTSVDVDERVEVFALEKQINDLPWVFVRKTLENALLRKTRKVTDEKKLVTLLSLRSVAWAPGGHGRTPRGIVT
jgi:hypothetical protein